MYPGCTEFTRMPYPPSSRASVLVTAPSAAFDPAYDPARSSRWWTDMVLIITMRASPDAAAAALTCPSIACVSCSVPK